MKNDDRALPHPAQASEDPTAHEVLRVWGAHRAQHVVIDLGDPGDLDPEGWGITLVDFVRHVAAAYAGLGRGPSDAIAGEVYEAFAKAWRGQLGSAHVTLARPRPQRPRELPAPAAAATDPKAFEILTEWDAEDGKNIVLNPNIWKDPSTWGLVLAELLNNIAAAFVEAGRMDMNTAQRRIADGFDAEWDHPTDMPRPGRL